MGNEKREKEIINSLRLHNPHIMLLQDTKIWEGEAPLKCRRIWKNYSVIASGSRGESRGLSNIWSLMFFRLVFEEKSQHSINTKLIHIPSRKIWNLFNINM